MALQQHIALPSCSVQYWYYIQEWLFLSTDVEVRISRSASVRSQQLHGTLPVESLSAEASVFCIAAQGTWATCLGMLEDCISRCREATSAAPDLTHCRRQANA